MIKDSEGNGFIFAPGYQGADAAQMPVRVRTASEIRRSKSLQDPEPSKAEDSPDLSASLSGE